MAVVCRIVLMYIVCMIYLITVLDNQYYREGILYAIGIQCVNDIYLCPFSVCTTQFLHFTFGWKTVIRCIFVYLLVINFIFTNNKDCTHCNTF
jgi:hypothetical protein